MFLIIRLHERVTDHCWFITFFALAGGFMDCFVRYVRTAIFYLVCEPRFCIWCANNHFVSDVRSTVLYVIREIPYCDLAWEPTFCIWGANHLCHWECLGLGQSIHIAFEKNRIGKWRCNSFIAYKMYKNTTNAFYCTSVTTAFLDINFPTYMTSSSVSVPVFTLSIVALPMWMFLPYAVIFLNPILLKSFGKRNCLLDNQSN